eukprot:5507098-Amphidinium_carterae.1
MHTTPFKVFCHHSSERRSSNATTVGGLPLASEATKPVLLFLLEWALQLRHMFNNDRYYDFWGAAVTQRTSSVYLLVAYSLQTLL